MQAIYQPLRYMFKLAAKSLYKSAGIALVTRNSVRVMEEKQLTKQYECQGEDGQELREIKDDFETSLGATLIFYLMHNKVQDERRRTQGVAQVS